MNKIEQRRVSSNSESSVEPMDISSPNKTLNSEANSSIAIKSSDHHESDSHAESEENESESPIRRENLRNQHLDTKMLRQKIRCGYKNSKHTKTTNICPICNVTMLTQHDLTEHIREHNLDGTQHYKCRICSKVLSSASSLDRHILVHSGERPFTCKFCHVTFTTNGNMHRHMRLHKQQGYDVNYDESDEGGDGGGSDTSSVASGDVILNQSLNNNNNNNNNKRKNNEDELTNQKRRIKTINNNNIITKLLTNQQNDTQQYQQQKFCCPVCERNDFGSMFALENHLDKEHPNIPARCRHCEVIFKSHKAFNAHHCSKTNQNVTQGFKDLTFVDFSSEKFPYIAKSMCEQSIRTPITPQKYECPKCYRAFPCTSSVEIHIKECGDSIAHDFSMRRKQRNSDSTSSDDDIESKSRNNFFANLDLQNKSLSNNSSPRSMNSDIKTPSLYQQDSKDLADIQSIINVTSSGGILRQLDKSVRDYSQASAGEEPEEQQDAFTAEFRKMKLRGEFPCKLCTAVFPNLRALKGHNRIHLSAAGAGPYRCNMCPYSINDKAALTRHMRTHNGDRPYECAVCNYAFTTKANCERHLKNRHAKTTRDEVKRAIIYHPSEDSTADDSQHSKKLSLYGGSPEFDDEDHIPKDRSTPVSHLKDLLMPHRKKDCPSPIKIQVKSLEKLIHQNVDDDIEEENDCHDDDDEGNISDAQNDEDTKPIDLSMDALDLSKKGKTESVALTALTANDQLSFLEKNQQFLFAQQQLLSEAAFSKLDPAHYFQLTNLYRNFVFPQSNFPIHPLLMQNAFLPSTNLNEMRGQMSGGNLIFPQSQQSHHQPHQPPPRIPTPSKTPLSELSSKPLNSSSMIPTTPTTASSSLPPQTIHQQSPGPVKMVIKNGVLMPKQKQRRYRTERPFACEHCSARFTLRSNMERHIKQQHPQFWAQRQRSGHSILRRSNIPTSSPQLMPSLASHTNNFQCIPDQVKHALTQQIAQQMKYNSTKDMPIHPITNNNNNSFNYENNNNNNSNNISNNISYQKEGAHNEEEDDLDDSELVIDEDSQPEDLTRIEKAQTVSPAVTNETSNVTEAKKIAENILEEVRKASSIQTNHASKYPATVETLNLKVERENYDEKLTKNLIVKNEKFKDEMRNLKEEGDLASVSKIVDDANLMSFGSFFPTNVEHSPMDHSDEEGLVASGSASESNASGTEDQSVQPTETEKPKKISAYSLAPNRVACPYCQRMFPWSSSLRRHILTHTGQKPFKCSHCPLLFTTKSNCDRHLLRKHRNYASATAIATEINEVAKVEPKKEPLSSDERPSSPELKIATSSPLTMSLLTAPLTAPLTNPAAQQLLQNQQQQGVLTTSILNLKTESSVTTTNAPASILSFSNTPVSSELPFKCHLCDGSFADRFICLEHIKNQHPQDFSLLMSKGAIEAEPESGSLPPANGPNDDDDPKDGKGKYPDYANRKVICAFCVRRFWSTEDLRRHMRTHSGERPFQCDICQRKFTLKHSMLRHQKKHSGQHSSGQQQTNSASDLSDEEQQSTPSTLPLALTNKSINIPEFFQQDLTYWKLNQLHQSKLNELGAAASILGANSLFPLFQNRTRKLSGTTGESADDESDLIGNLLGISDQGILNRVLFSSADEAAKLLGVEK